MFSRCLRGNVAEATHYFSTKLRGGQPKLGLAHIFGNSINTEKRGERVIKHLISEGMRAAKNGQGTSLIITRTAKHGLFGQKVIPRFSTNISLRRLS